jgi:hypothetical protein
MEPSSAFFVCGWVWGTVSSIIKGNCKGMEGVHRVNSAAASSAKTSRGPEDDDRQ